jgi:hypothetical protein
MKEVEKLRRWEGEKGRGKWEFGSGKSEVGKEELSGNLEVGLSKWEESEVGSRNAEVGKGKARGAWRIG